MAGKSAPQLQSVEDGAVAVTHQLKSAFLNLDGIPWTPWVMADTWFKLLAVNTVTGGFSMMLKVGPDNVAPVHGHVGSVEGMILDGGFAYDDDWGHAGDYVYEPAGINHKPRTGPDGMVMFAIAHGPLVGYAEDGAVAGVVDERMMFDMAEAAGCTGHLDKPAHWKE